MFKTIKRAFTWYEVRDGAGHAAYCKGTKYQFTLAEAKAFVRDLRNDEKHANDTFQIVRVFHSEKTI